MNQIETIAQLAEQVRTAANGLDARILRFQAYLGALRGRVEVRMETVHDFAIVFKRTGNQWILYIDADPLQPLVEASLKRKMQAMQLFPDLLLAIEEGQQTLIANLKAAVSQCDAFLESLDGNPHST